MAEYDPKMFRQVSPAKIAKDLVFALSAINRGEAVSLEILHRGADFCRYMLSLVDETYAPATEEAGFIFRAILSDSNALRENEINPDEVLRMRKLFDDLIENPASRSQSDIEKVQEQLLRTTIAMWRNRSQEPRDDASPRRIVPHA